MSCIIGKSYLCHLEMKNIFVIFFTFIMLLSSGRHVGHVLYFAMNKAYVVSELCVERFVEESTCEGKCYLKAKVSSTSDTDSNTKIPVEQLTERWQFVQELMSREQCDFFKIGNSLPSTIIDFYQRGLFVDIFHPPRR